MPGAGAHRWQWIAKPPLYWTILLVLIMGHLAVSLLLFLRCLAGHSPYPMRPMRLNCVCEVAARITGLPRWVGT